MYTYLFQTWTGFFNIMLLEFKSAKHYPTYEWDMLANATVICISYESSMLLSSRQDLPDREKFTTLLCSRNVSVKHTFRTRGVL